MEGNNHNHNYTTNPIANTFISSGICIIAYIGTITLTDVQGWADYVKPFLPFIALVSGGIAILNGSLTFFKHFKKKS